MSFFYQCQGFHTLIGEAVRRSTIQKVGGLFPTPRTATSSLSNHPINFPKGLNKMILINFILQLSISAFVFIFPVPWRLTCPVSQTRQNPNSLWLIQEQMVHRWQESLFCVN